MPVNKHTSVAQRLKEVYMLGNLLLFLSSGLVALSWWQVLLSTIVMTHITIVSVTLYLHRCLAHRSLDLHPAVRHFFRFWLG